MQLPVSWAFCLFYLYVIPKGLNIPVGWRLPSYKILKGYKELKASFVLCNLLIFCDPEGIQTLDLQNRNLTLYSAKLRDRKAGQRYEIIHNS